MAAPNRRRTRRTVARSVRKTFLYGTAALAVFLTLAPFIWLWLLASKPPVEALQLPPTLIYRPIFDAFAEVWNDAAFSKAFFNSVWIVLAGIALAQVIGIPAAYKMSKFRSTIDRGMTVWLLAVYILPPFLFAIPMFVLYQEVGLFDTEIGVAIMYQVLVLPLTIWLLTSFFNAIPDELDQAAKIDGATRFQTLRYIYVPLIRPGMATAAILAGIIMWNELTIALTLTFSEARTVSLAVAGFRGYSSANWDLIAAASLITLIPMLALAMVAQRYIVRGLTAGAVK